MQLSLSGGAGVFDRIFLFVFLIVATHFSVFAQPQPLTYYLPDIAYDEAIPTPESFFGFQIGEWHLSHDQQYHYMKALAAASPRITLTEYARTHENRPLVYLTITSEANHARLEEIRQQHVALSDPDRSGDLDTRRMPAVLYQGFSIHGNEPSGGNAAPLVAYYLAAGQSPEVQQLLDNAVILFDPCYNPDGFTRFSTWANMHKNKNLTTDPQDREYNEVWPRGRTNHYWFDLNRDWLPMQHPESRGRINTFHEWKPNVLTDHHEMSTNATFFFMPGIPERTNPITPWKNQELTAKIGNYHAAALDEIGSLYFTQERYDDFYYGKGSTYPDANGCVGILFEQASARGHAQETDNGLLTFPFAIRNQVRTALSTHRALREMREELLTYQRDFYRSARDEAAKDTRKAYVFGDLRDPARTHQLVEMMRRHQITVHELGRAVSMGGQDFEPGWAFIVPTEQTQYRLIRGMFETMTTFQDSLFYDISSWTLPLAFNLAYAEVPARAFSKDLLGKAVTGLRPEAPAVKPVTRSGYAYLLSWDHYYAPQALTYLLHNGLRAKVSTRSFNTGEREFPAGTIMIPVHNQEKDPAAIYELMKTASESSGTPIYGVATGLTPEGIDLGSSDFETLRDPKVLLMVGDGVSSYEAGEIWHLLDTRYHLPVTKGETTDFTRMDLDRYNVIIMPDGSYSPLNQGGADQKLRDWLRKGGVVVAQHGAVEWLQKKGLAYVEFRKDDQKNKPARPYGMLENDLGSEGIGGAIFEAMLDVTHPLGFGYHRDRLPVFRRGTLFFEPARNPYATPLRYTDEPLLSGYIKDSKLQLLKGSAGAVVSGQGSGRVICLADNHNFRAFWYGTNKLFANAIFFGHIINGRGVEQAPKKEEGK